MSRIAKALWERKLHIVAHTYIALSIFMFTESALGTLLIAPIALVAYISIAEELAGDNVIGVIVVRLPEEVEGVQDVAEALAKDISEDANIPVTLMVLDADEVAELQRDLTLED
jgi:hypothetical protein